MESKPELNEVNNVNNIEQNEESKARVVNDSGRIEYIPDFLTQQKAAELYDHLLNNVNWDQGAYKMYGKVIKTPRLLSSMKDEEFKMEDAYKATVYNTGGWTEPVKEVKEMIEKRLGIKIIYAQMNYYRNGKDYIGFHADRELDEGGVIASISLGAERKFVLHKKLNKQKKYEFFLENGSLLTMDYKAANKNYKHSLPKAPKVTEGRINITFRNK